MTYKSFSCDLLNDIAVAVGTPTYVYQESVVTHQIRQIKEIFSGFDSEILYAMKANSNPRILETMRRESVGIDAVSPVELKLALACGFSPKDIWYSANNMTDEEMHLAYSAGVTMNFGDLERFRLFAEAYPRSSACIRVNPARGAGHHEFVVTAGKRSKFGIGLGKIAEVKEIARAHEISLDGLHQHIGSGNLELDLISESMLSLLEIAEEFEDLKFINFGGGFGVPYEPGGKPIDVYALHKMIEPKLRDFVERRTRSKDFTFLVEPGRFLVAESGALLIRVTNVKRVADQIYVGTNSGMNHLVRPAMYGAYHEVLNVSNPDGTPSRYNVVGNICESSDFFGLNRSIPEVRIGDVLAIMDVGAYGISMASSYNLRQLPAEVLISENGDVNVITERVGTDAAVEAILNKSTNLEVTLNARQ